MNIAYISLNAKLCDGCQKRGGPAKSWLKKGFELIGGLAIYGLRKWKKEWLLLTRGASLTSNDGMVFAQIVQMQIPLRRKMNLALKNPSENPFVTLPQCNFQANFSAY